VASDLSHAYDDNIHSAYPDRCTAEPGTNRWCITISTASNFANASHRILRGSFLNNAQRVETTAIALILTSMCEIFGTPE
jgi:hypothetical protein